LGKTAFVLLDVGERPNAVICVDCVVTEVEEGLRASHVAEDDIVRVFDVVLFVELLVWVYLGIGKVNREVKKIFVLDEIVVYLLLRSTGSRRVSLVFAGSYLKNVMSVVSGGILSLKVESGVERRTEPVTRLQRFEVLYDVGVLFPILSAASL
jgi:hypothetical protein